MALDNVLKIFELMECSYLTQNLKINPHIDCLRDLIDLGQLKKRSLNYNQATLARIKKGSSALHTDPRQVNDHDFPLNGNTKAKLCFLLHYAVLAPSAHNAQPWQFRVQEDSIDLLLDPKRALSIVDPENREMIISCGAAIGNLEVAARFFNYQAKVQLSDLQESSDCLAKISLSPGSQASQQDMALFYAIKERQTNRRPFSNEKIAEVQLQQCAEFATKLDVQFSFYFEDAIKSEIAKLTMFADKAQFAEPWFRAELASWMHSRRHPKQDGMSARRFGVPDILTPIASFIVKRFNLGRRIALSNKKKIEESSPVLGVFATQENNKVAWLNTGRALAHSLLVFQSTGFCASYLNQSIETGYLQQLLKIEFDVLPYPQLLIRIGRAEATQYSVRRSLADCILD